MPSGIKPFITWVITITLINNTKPHMYQHVRSEINHFITLTLEHVFDHTRTWYGSTLDQEMANHCLTPNSCLIQCCLIVIYTLRNKPRWNFNQNAAIFIQENAFENAVCKTVGHFFFLPKYVNITKPHMYQHVRSEINHFITSTWGPLWPLKELIITYLDYSVSFCDQVVAR